MPDSSDLFALANEYLEACSAALIDTPGGPIARAFVSPGLPSWDCCPQLSVHVGSPALADTAPLSPILAPGHRATVQGQLNLISLTATVLRCAPTMAANGDFPLPATIDVCSRESYADLWSIWNHLRLSKNENTLFAPREREMIVDPAISLNQMGGCCGWQIGIRVQLNGYKPTI